VSIEKLIEANTAALIALNETFSKMSSTGAKPAAPAGKAAAASGLTYDDIKVPFLALCKSHGADAGRAVCKEFGHENLKTVKPEQFAAVLAAIKKVAEAPAA
jgi:hypothetical protein